MLALPLLALSAADPFGLGTAWASAFVPVAARGARVADVAGLRLAAAKGGTIRLAAGTYDLGTAGLELSPGTVLVGAGRGATVLQGQSGETGFVLKTNGANVGLRSLTLRNLGGGFTQRGDLGKPNDRNFWVDVDFDLGQGLTPWPMTPRGMLIRDCRFTAKSPRQGPLRIQGGSDVVLDGCEMTYRATRVVLQFIDGLTVIHNTLTLDGSLHRWGDRSRDPVETGGIEISYSYHARIAGNTIVQTGGADRAYNDGEMILTQGGSPPEWAGAGVVRSATALRVVTDMRWGSDPWLSVRHPVSRRKVLYVLSGKSRGEWRWAAPGPDGTVMVDRPLSVAPGDRVAVNSLSVYDLTIESNVVRGGTVGIEIYQGGIKVVVRKNLLIDTGSLIVRSDSRTSRGRTPHSGLETWPLIDARIEGNTIRNRGEFPAALAIVDADAMTDLPLGMLRVTATDNSIEGRDAEREGLLAPFDGIQVQEFVGPNPRAGRPGRMSDVVLKRNTVRRGRTVDTTSG